ncbi:hypothetical protein AB0H83_51555 [Dactylosporangium sp. NPDC050688]|uniref:hypothetical protein n=1 Tax=Dactylosporangium sp. NPDC050688 TaxID=3157217 RepID=UPI0033F801FA
MRRKMLVEGRYCTIECAVRQDGTSPAEWFLDQLKDGVWEDDPDMTKLPDDAQISDFYKLMSWLEVFAEEGLPPYQHAVNYLEEGIWEFKIGAKRLTFYDTPGNGSFVPKPKIRDEDVTEYKDEFWWFPEFDEFVRLGHFFPKLGRWALDSDIDEAVAVRKEDIQHDKEVE